MYAFYRFLNAIVLKIGLTKTKSNFITATFIYIVSQKILNLLLSQILVVN